MQKEKMLKVLGIFVIALVVLNFILFLFGRINYIWFWFNMIFFAIIAYFGFPQLAKAMKKR